MFNKNFLQKQADFIFKIPQTYQKGMRVEAWVLTSPAMLEQILTDRSLVQLINVTFLPGVQEKVVVMPDVHEGYGFPIGAVAAVSLNKGVISPGGIGYDINCGVRLLLSKIAWQEAAAFLTKIGQAIFAQVPAGVGLKSDLKINQKELEAVLTQGLIWANNRGYTQPEDQNYIESGGVLKEAWAEAVSPQAKARGLNQLGTMGAGNHFVEIGYVAEIYQPQIAKAFGLFPNQLTVLIHTGSRGLGHQVATDYIRQMIKVMPKYGIALPDWELACAPFRSSEGQAYFSAMQAAANFAWVNRQIITFKIRQVFQKILGSCGKLAILYDVAHNIAKVEEHLIKKAKEKVLVHRKGATRAFGPNGEELPLKFQKIGQPVIIPGSMGTASFVLVGTQKALELTFGSSCHGAGRQMSRKKAVKAISGSLLKQNLTKQGIAIFTPHLSQLAEEAPFAYKDVSQVVEVVDQIGIAQKVAKLKPLAVIKG